jgi:AcrR family transcriptional regulator
MSDEMTAKRRYELRKRADEMAGTRRRITEAAVRLHGTVGPARTTLSAVAQEAGVQRQTVYRHFPTEADLFAACSAHWAAANPWPDLEAWRAVDDPRERLVLALDELFDWYGRTEPMLANVLRDLELVEALRPAAAPIERFFDEAAHVLAVGWGVRGRRRDVLAVALRHAVDFHVWRSLAWDTGVTRAEAVRLAAALVEEAAAPSASRRAAA